MPKYFYIAKSLKGEEKSSGVMEARDTHQLAETLKNQGFILIKAELEKGKSGKRKINFSVPFFGGVSLTERMMFTRNLQVMISAGLPLPRSLETLALQSKSKVFKKALLEIKEEVTKGKSFSETLEKYPNIFSELFQSMIRVGEESGTSEDVLKVLTRQMEKEHELRSKIQGAIMYPTVILCTMIGIGVLMLVMVVPKLAETFKELEIELPVTTKIVIGLGTFLVEKWFLIVPIIIGFSFLFWMVLRTQTGKKIIDTLFLKLPIISPLIKKTNSASTVRTLSSLIASGVPIVKSLEIVSGTLGNMYYKNAVLAAAQIVRKGGKLSEALSVYQDIYPPIVFQMIQVGEETGETTTILSKLADFFEEEVTTTTKNLSSIIEPILMIFVGVAVGFFAISMFQPMYSMLGNI